MTKYPILCVHAVVPPTNKSTTMPYITFYDKRYYKRNKQSALVSILGGGGL